MTIAQPLKSPPGHWFLGHFRVFRNDPLAYLTQCVQGYGDVVPLRFINRRIVILNDPALIAEVLITKHRQFKKHLALQLARPALGDGILLSENDSWQRKRQLMQPAFRSERIQNYAQIMLNHTQSMLQKWSNGQSLDIHAAMMNLTSGIVTTCLLGTELGNQSAAAAHAMDSLTDAFKRRNDAALRLPLSIPTPANIRFKRDMTAIDSVLHTIIRERRAGPPQSDLLGMLLAAVDENGKLAFNDQQLRDEVATLFFAGHETTANALTWTLWLLSQHPDVREKLEKHLDEVLGTRAPTAADLPQLSYCRYVLEESMRIRPPVWILGREAITDLTIGDISIASGTTVLMSQWTVHRDQRWFTNPDTFNPDRWANGLAEQLPTCAYFPFGAGPRICIGHSFARMEMVLLLSSIIQQYRCEIPPNTKIEMVPTITLRPKNGLHMSLTKRSREEATVTN